MTAASSRSPTIGGDPRHRRPARRGRRRPAPPPASSRSATGSCTADRTSATRYWSTTLWSPRSRSCLLAPLHNPAESPGSGPRGHSSRRPARRRLRHRLLRHAAGGRPTYAIPRELAEQQRIRRYGFHGTSHQYVSRAAAAFLGRDVGSLNQIVLHLGNGASMPNYLVQTPVILPAKSRLMERWTPATANLAAISWSRVHRSNSSRSPSTT